MPAVPSAPAPAPAPAALIPVSPELQFVLDQVGATIESLRQVVSASNSMETRQLADASASLVEMRAKFQRGEMSPDVLGKLVQLAQACQQYDFKTAQKISADLATAEWVHTKAWHKGVRSVIMLALIKSSGGR
jgi:hypothetical protein